MKDDINRPARSGQTGALLAAAAAVLLMAAPGRIEAQRGRGGGQAPPTARATAPIDLTGYWVSLITEDWRYRMGVGIHGDFGRSAIPLNDAGQEAARRWDPDADTVAGLACKAYGAGGVMRMPGRVQFTWVDDDTLQIEADAGMQTRTLRFGNAETPSGEPTWQGHSVARWVFAASAGRGSGGQPPPGELEVVTTHMRPGYYYWLDGMPYGERAMMRERFARIVEPNGDEYLLVTIFMDDPEYLAQPYIDTVHFKKEPDDSKWSPRPCSAN